MQILLARIQVNVYQVFTKAPAEGKYLFGSAQVIHNNRYAKGEIC